MLEERVGQLVHFADSSTGPGAPHSDYREQVAQGKVGSLENITGAAETNALQKLAIEKSRLHIPLVLALDVIHGYRTIFPVPLAMASTWDPSMVERASRIAAKEAASEGIRWTYSPMVDIARDARWGRIVEGAGEDPYLGSAMAAAYVRGYQGTRLDDPQSMLACVKHFVGYGAAQGGKDYNSVELSDRTLRQVYLPPFHAAVEAGVGSVMSAFSAINGVPATSNAFTLTHVLREEWGFKGVVISDYGSIREMIAKNNGKRLYAASKIPPKNERWPAQLSYKYADVFPPEHVFRYANPIRKQVGTDSIDLLQFHVWTDEWTDEPDFRKTVEKLKHDGIIREFGLSLNRWQPKNGIKAIRTGLVDAVQVIYSIFDQSPEDELFPVCQELNIGVIVRVALDEGSLGGKMTRETKFPSTDWRSRYFNPENLAHTMERVDRLKQVLPPGISLPELALRFVLSHPAVSTTVVGMRKSQHVRENTALCDLGTLSPTLLAELKRHRWDRKPAPWSD